MIRYFCDKCYIELKAHDPLYCLNINRKGFSKDAKDKPFQIKMLLCPICYEKLTKFINNVAQNEVPLDNNYVMGGLAFDKVNKVISSKEQKPITMIEFLNCLRKNVINDYVVNDLSAQEVADKYGVTLSTMRSWLKQNKISKQLKEKGCCP